uniref:Uncharacterized protein LOC111101433 n=1 Tax=Crassostrea virginica TaxID=6565 RepID=A0A8B8AGH9_CRAVI|nr:uncharacterized protein LOC111101433 [Crassostrea virginica]XP_022289629.1 uncharacterized protein LOC111101433 [Crassostrea virginica]
MKLRIFLVFCTFLTIPSPIQSKSKALDVTGTAMSLFGTILDLFEIATENDDYQELTKQLSDFQHNLDSGFSSLFSRLDKSTFQNALTGYVNTIDSCETDYLNYVTDPSDASMKNLLKCNGVMESVRPLGKYLSGTRIIDGPLLFDLYKNNEGICNGSAMESVYKTLFAKYVIGCTVATSVERIEHTANTSVYATECRDTMSKVRDYVKILYNDCARLSCKVFHCSVQTLLNPPGSPKYLHEKLSKNYPWFNFLVFQSSKGGKTKLGGNFLARHDDHHLTNKTTYDIFYFDGFTQLTEEKQNFSLVVEVSKYLLNGQYFGNSTMEERFHDGLEHGTFEGYAPKANSLCIDKNTEDNRDCSTTGASSILRPGITCNLIFCLLFFVRLSMAL